MVSSSVHEPRAVIPCIRSARGKCVLTNQDSAGGKNFTFLTSMQVNRKGIEIRHFFLAGDGIKDVRAQKFPRTDFFKTSTAGRK